MYKYIIQQIYMYVCTYIIHIQCTCRQQCTCIHAGGYLPRPIGGVQGSLGELGRLLSSASVRQTNEHLVRPPSWSSRSGRVCEKMTCTYCIAKHTHTHIHTNTHTRTHGHKHTHTWTHGHTDTHTHTHTHMDTHTHTHTHTHKHSPQKMI